MIKRALDLVGAIFGLFLFSPILVLTAVIIRIDSPGPIFFRGSRIGRGGHAFSMMKFRTMRMEADASKEEAGQKVPSRRVTDQQFQKIVRDPRLTRVGRFLRRSSIDELPQLWNVLAGDMSLVGPRPFIPSEQEYYGESYNQYIRVRPGMTGLWQVSGRSQLSFAERVQLDNYYFENWSLKLDFSVLARTFWVVIKGEGAF